MIRKDENHFFYPQTSNQFNELFWAQEIIIWIFKIIKLNAFILLGYQTNTDASILVYKFHPERTGLNIYAEYTS